MLLRRLAAAAAVALVLAVTTPATATADTAATSSERRDASGGSVRIESARAGALDARAAELVAGMTPREKAATVVMGHVPTTDAAVLRDYMADTGIGGFILMGANIPGTEVRLRELTAALAIDPALPPLIAVDQEGGDVSRLPWDDFASALTLKGEPPEAAERAFAARGALVQRAGIGLNFGIVADVTGDRSSFIYRRALGTTPQDGAERVAAAVRGEAGAALSTLKHFPGHGAAPGDSHTVIPTTDISKAAWSTVDGAPFAAGIAAGAPVLMFGHLAFTAVDRAPASLSSAWHAIARDELGFGGVMITDDLGMLQATGLESYSDPVRNAVAALAAGNDMVLAVVFSTPSSAPRIVDGIVAAVEGGALPADRLDDAATRVLTLRLRLAAEGRGLIPCDGCAPAP